jgi:protein subunit release factor B
MEKEILFSVTAKDCDWSYTKGTGKGGTKKNKTASAVHCMHRPSGAHGYCEESRSQYDNKSVAFEKMAKTKEFQEWLKLETARRTGMMAEIDENVRKELRKVKVETKIDGKWVEVDKDDPLHRNSVDEDRVHDQGTSI